MKKFIRFRRKSLACLWRTVKRKSGLFQRMSPERSTALADEPGEAKDENTLVKTSQIQPGPRPWPCGSILGFAALFFFLGHVAYGENKDQQSNTEKNAIEITETRKNISSPDGQYVVGVDDIIQIQVIQPEQIATTSTVSPDGFISFHYIGSVKVKGKTLPEIQEEIEHRLADGYMKYPIVAVTLQESRSRKFFVYGEVNKPGMYPLEENTTVLRAISMAGGFTKYGSSSQVKVLKPKNNHPGYEITKMNVSQVMEDAQKDMLLSNGDIVVISEGIF
jgi:protein involved in polysaccharide export with SLBB domain